MFGHEKFKAYELSIEFLAAAMRLLDQLPNGNGHICDQLKRAATSDHSDSYHYLFKKLG